MARAEEYAALCCPDQVFTENTQADFVSVDLLELDDSSPSTVGLQIVDNFGIAATHLFTKWSRTQLLSLVGTREKWFNPVSTEEEARELNERVHLFKRHRLKTMRSADPDVELRIVRGLVSSSYATIPDTLVLKALSEELPEGEVLQIYSDMTDRALYAYIITGDEISIPDTSFRGYPGVVVKNSEVGYCALHMLPMLYEVSCFAPLIFNSTMAFRKIHRGSTSELREAFTSALDELKTVWGPIKEKLFRLGAISYSDEDAAVLSLRTGLLKLRSTKAFAYRCEQIYRTSNHNQHSALEVLNALLCAVREKVNDQDEANAASALAGALLLTLV